MHHHNNMKSINYNKKLENINGEMDVFNKNLTDLYTNIHNQHKNKQRMYQQIHLL